MEYVQTSDVAGFARVCRCAASASSCRSNLGKYGADLPRLGVRNTTAAS